MRKEVRTMDLEMIRDNHEFSQERLVKLSKKEQIEMVQKYLQPDKYTLNKEKLKDLDDDVRYLILDKYAKKRPLYVVNNIDAFNIKDDRKRYELAKQIIEQDIKFVAYVDKFKIANEEMRIQLLKELMDREDPVSILNEVKKFNITNQEALVDIAKTLLEDKNLSEVLAAYIEDLGIKDEKQRLYFAKEIANINGRIVPIYLECFNINDQQELFDMAKALIPKYGYEVAISMSNFKIEDASRRLELANMLAKNNGYELVRNLEQFKISNEDDLFNLANKIAKSDGKTVAENIEKFNIQDEQKRIKIATTIAKNGGISKNIKKFNISDEKERIKIAKMAMCSEASEVTQFIKDYNISDKQVLKDMAYNVAILDDTAMLRNNLADYGIKDLKDVSCIFDMMISQDNWNIYKLKTIDKYNEELNKIYDKMSIIKVLPVGALRMMRFFNKSKIDEIILCKHKMKNLKKISEFYRDKIMGNVELNINIDMEAILGLDNAKSIENAINNIGNPRDMIIAKEIVEKVLFAQINVSTKLEYKDALTKLMLELITVKKIELKQQLLPNVVKYIHDGKLKKLEEEIKQTDKKKAYPGINAILFDMLSLNDNAELLKKARSMFYSSNFIKDSKSLQDVYLTIMKLQRTHLEKSDISNIMEYLLNSSKKLKEDAKYISSIISFNRVDDLKVVRKDSKPNEIRGIFYDIYRGYLNVNGNEDFIKDYEQFVNKAENKKRNLEELIMKYVADNNKYVEVMTVVRKFIETMSDTKKFRDLRYDKEQSEHLSKINEINKEVYDKWTKGQKEFEDQYSDGSARVTDDPVDLFLIGTEVDGSCQSISHGGDLNKCLMGYVIDGKNKAVAIKNKDGKIIARSIIRLFIDKRNDKVVMVREKPYKSVTVNDSISKQLDAKCIEYAKWLGVSLVREKPEKGQVFDNDLDLKQQEIFKDGLVCKKGLAPYEYVDSANKYYEGVPYEISNELIYLYKNE